MIINKQKNKASFLQDEALFTTLKAWFEEDLSKVIKWRKEAREDYEFYNGHQWNNEDKQLLQEQKRPVMTFNRIAPLVNAILGSERNNKRELRYIPRELGDAKANELLSAIAEWFRQQADGEYEDSEAFSDMVICGMGWTDTRLDFEKNFEGEPVIQRLDPLKMVWDCNAVKSNLFDAERLWYVDEKPLSVAKAMFPDVPDHMLHADWALNGDLILQKNSNIRHYETVQDDNLLNDSKRSYVTMVEARWLEHEVFYKIFNLTTQQSQECSEDSYRLHYAQDANIKAVRFTKKMVKRAFLGKNLLAPPDRPLVPEGQLGWECITGYYDRFKEQFYGVVRSTKDPQRWNNKFFSQIMYLLNSQTKGGILAERGAFESDIQAEESLSRSDQITWLRNGALGRIQPKPAGQFPNGFFALFQETKEAITQVTGISAEFIGTRGISQAGILENQRRQSSLNLLAQFYDALRRYRKRQGAIILYLIQNHLSDGRLIRILGPNQGQYVALSREQFANRQYDIIVDDAPTSPNEKERSFATMEAMMPYLKPYLTPEVSLEILKYSPLPLSFVEKLRQIVLTQQQEAADKERQNNTANEVNPEEAYKLKALSLDMEAKQQKHQLELQEALLDLQKKQQENENLTQKIANDKLKNWLSIQKLMSD